MFGSSTIVGNANQTTGHFPQWQCEKSLFGSIANLFKMITCIQAFVMTLNCTQVLLFSLIIRDGSTTWSPPLVNSVDCRWFRKACDYKSPTVNSAWQSTNQTIKSKELSVNLSDRIVEAQLGRGTERVLEVQKVKVWDHFVEKDTWPNWVILEEGP